MELVKKMKKIILFFLSVSTACAYQSYQGWCEQGGQTITTAGMASTTKVQVSYPLCTVTVFPHGSRTPVASSQVWSDNSGTVLGNPFTADSQGHFVFFAANAHYDVQRSGTIPTWTEYDILLADPFAAGSINFTNIAGIVAVSQGGTGLSSPTYSFVSGLPGYPSTFPPTNTGNWAGTWQTYLPVHFETALGNPSVDGYVLSSTAAGVRSWVLQSGFPSGTQLQYLRIKPNTGNNATLQFAGLPEVNPDDYDFPAESISAPITATTNVVIMPIVPFGVNGSDSNHLLYISGTGTPGACLIIGGTGVAGGINGQIILDCSASPTFPIRHATSCSASCTIASATGGLKEAYVSFGGYGEIRIPTASARYLHGPFVMDLPGPTTISGGHHLYSQAWRAADYPNGDLFYINNSSAEIYLHDFLINNWTASGTAGDAIHAYSATSTIMPPVWIQNLDISDGPSGITLDGAQGVLDHVTAQHNHGTGTGNALNVISTNGGISDVFIDNSSFTSQAGQWDADLYVTAVDGLSVTNTFFGGGDTATGGSAFGMFLAAAAGRYITNVYVHNSFFDANTVFGVGIEGSTGNMCCMIFANNHVNGQYQAASSFSGQYSGFDIGNFYATNAGDINLIGNDIVGWGTSAIAMGTSPANARWSIKDNHMLALDRRGLNTPAIIGSGSLSGISVTGNVVANHSPAGGGLPVGTSNQGFLVLGNLDQAEIKDNNFYDVLNYPMYFGGTINHTVISGNNGNAIPISFNGAITNSVVANNTGIDDVIGTATFGSGTLTIPFYPIFILPAGTNNITGILIRQPGGSRGQFRVLTIPNGGGTNTFTADGTTLGNSGVASPGKSYTWYVDGSGIVWISGSGF